VEPHSDTCVGTDKAFRPSTTPRINMLLYYWNLWWFPITCFFKLNVKVRLQGSLLYLTHFFCYWAQILPSPGYTLQSRKGYPHLEVWASSTHWPTLSSFRPQTFVSGVCLLDFPSSVSFLFFSNLEPVSPVYGIISTESDEIRWRSFLEWLYLSWRDWVFSVSGLHIFKCLYGYCVNDL
jgi:hypothetical protein